MAHPKHTISKQKRDKRRTHDFAPVPTLSVCPNCGATVMYHRVCPECGYAREAYGAHICKTAAAS